MKTNYPVESRNELLLKMFTENGFDAQLVGNYNQPAIVIDKKFAIAGYVHNKTYHFCDKPFGGTEVFSVHLSENPSISRAKILELIDQSEKRRLYKIKVKFDQYSMWFNNFRNDHIYFSPTDIRYYFSFMKASEAQDLLRAKGYEAIIESPEL